MKKQILFLAGTMIIVPTIATASAPAPVPEPGTIFLIISGLIGLAAAGKKFLK